MAVYIFLLELISKQKLNIKLGHLSFVMVSEW